MRIIVTPSGIYESPSQSSVVCNVEPQKNNIGHTDRAVNELFWSVIFGSLIAAVVLKFVFG